MASNVDWLDYINAKDRQEAASNNNSNTQWDQSFTARNAATSPVTTASYEEVIDKSVTVGVGDFGPDDGLVDDGGGIFYQIRKRSVCSTRRGLAVAACGMILLLASCGLLVAKSERYANTGTGGGEDSPELASMDSDHASQDKERMNPLDSPERTAAIIDTAVSLSGMDAEKEGTPQYKAVDWLIHHCVLPLDAGETDPFFVQRYAVAVLYFALGGETDAGSGMGQGWPFKESWLNPLESECKFPGVKCNDEHLIESLGLESLGLRGEIPIEISLLSNLQWLDLSNNHIKGEIPRSIDRLKSLENLYLQFNALHGEISPSICNLPRLMDLRTDCASEYISCDCCTKCFSREEPPPPPPPASEDLTTVWPSSSSTEDPLGMQSDEDEDPYYKEEEEEEDEFEDDEFEEEEFEEEEFEEEEFEEEEFEEDEDEIADEEDEFEFESEEDEFAWSVEDEDQEEEFEMEDEEEFGYSMDEEEQDEDEDEDEDEYYEEGEDEYYEEEDEEHYEMEDNKEYYGDEEEYMQEQEEAEYDEEGEEYMQDEDYLEGEDFDDNKYGMHSSFDPKEPDVSFEFESEDEEETGAGDPESNNIAPHQPSGSAMNPAQRAKEVEQKIIKMSGHEAATTVGSPQNQAMAWIINDDKLQLKADDLYFPERYSMAVLFFALGGKEWTKTNKYGVPVTWLAKDQSVCTFPSVDCDGKAMVTAITLESSNLKGEIPPEIGYLEALRWLDLSNNHISGSIPEQMGRLTKLESLLLHENNIHGDAPTAVCSLDLSLYMVDCSVDCNCCTGCNDGNDSV